MAFSGNGRSVREAPLSALWFSEALGVASTPGPTACFYADCCVPRATIPVRIVAAPRSELWARRPQSPGTVLDC